MSELITIFRFLTQWRVYKIVIDSLIRNVFTFQENHFQNTILIFSSMTCGKNIPATIQNYMATLS